jgi:hypothetical protein
MRIDLLKFGEDTVSTPASYRIARQGAPGTPSADDSDMTANTMFCHFFILGIGNYIRIRFERRNLESASGRLSIVQWIRREDNKV